MLQNTAAAGKPADFFNLGYSYMDRERVSVEGRTGVSTVASAKAAYGVETIGEYLNVLSRQTRSQNGAFGLKVDLNHASILMRDGYFFDPAWNWKYIYVTRHDLVQQAVSYAIAQNTGHWSQTGAVQEAPLPSRDAVIDALLFLSDLMRRWECIFSLLGILPLRVSYEEIAGDPRGCLERCLQHIGVSAPENLQLSSNYVKQRSAESERLADEIRNGFRL